jgi:outer membrane protein OmpA-like peptidoglycan-associated protein
MTGLRTDFLQNRAILFTLVVARCAFSQPPLPVEAGFLANAMELHSSYELWNEMTFPRYGGKLHSGKHWEIIGSISGAADTAATWKTLKAAFLANGWTLLNEFTVPEQFDASLQYRKNSVEAWARIAIPRADEVLVDLVEAGPLPYLFALPPPKSGPEKIDPLRTDLPCAAPLPGSKPTGSRSDPAPFLITLPDASQPELISTGSVIKSYSKPDGMSGALFVVEYRAALNKAGWDIVNESTGAEASVLAHYGKGRRNLWASFRWSKDNYEIQVAEPSVQNIDRALSDSCHVVVPAILFEFKDAPDDDPSSLTLDPPEFNATPGEATTQTATTTISIPGSFRWRVVKEKEEDDPTAFRLTASTCAGQKICHATIQLLHPGFANVQVTFEIATTTQIMVAESIPVLQQLLVFLKKHRRMQVEVQGHTDGDGTDAYHQVLSDSQASAVVAWLTRHGISSRRLTAKGYGKAHPLIDQETEQARAANHRIEIAVPACLPKRQKDPASPQAQ